LDKERGEMDSKGRAINDYHLRNIVRKTLEDLAFVFSKLENKQLKKVSETSVTQIERMLSVVADRLAQACGGWRRRDSLVRIKKYRMLAHLVTPDPSEILVGLAQGALDLIYGEGVMVAAVYTKEGYEDYTDWWKANRKNKVVWKEGSEKRKR
jgi:hypothetical protein